MGLPDTVEIFAILTQYKDLPRVKVEDDNWDCINWVIATLPNGSEKVVGFNVINLGSNEEADNYEPVAKEALGWEPDVIEDIFDEALAF